MAAWVLDKVKLVQSNVLEWSVCFPGTFSVWDSVQLPTVGHSGPLALDDANATCQAADFFPWCSFAPEVTFCSYCNAYQTAYRQAWIQDDNSLFHPKTWYLPMFYLASLVLFLFYVLQERSCLHLSELTELVSLLCMLLLIVVPTYAIFAAIEWPSALQAYFSCMGTLLGVICFEILVRHLGYTVHPRFHQGRASMDGTARQLHKKQNSHCRESPSMKAIRIASKIEESLDRCSMHSWFGEGKHPEGRFRVLLLCLSCGGYCVLLDPVLASAVEHSLKAVLCILLAYVVFHLVFALCSYRLETRDIRHMLKRLVHFMERENLQYVIHTVSLTRLLHLAPDILELLCTTALEADLLDVATKAIIIDALQKLEIGLSMNLRLQKHVVRLIESCRGKDLTLLKTLIDGGCNYLSFHKLVYSDICDENLREALLHHVGREAQALRQKLGRRVGVKVLSDIDDTNKASSGRPAGVDKQYPKGTIYPGCFAMYRALDLDWNSGEPSCNLVFLSARPHIYKAESEEHVFLPMIPYFTSGKLHSFPTLLPGKLFPSVRAGIMQYCTGARAWRAVGQAKYETFQEYKALFAEYDFVFCGDDGQGDLLAGQQMIQECEACVARGEDSPKLLAVLIHKVLPESLGPAQVLDEELDEEQDLNWEQRWHQRGLILHRTYVGAAVSLHEYNPHLISKETVAEVSRRAVEEFDSARLMQIDRWGEQQWQAATEDLLCDVTRANTLLSQAPSLGSVEMPKTFKQVLQEELSTSESDEDAMLACAQNYSSDEWLS
eukprot:TRINITY_DN79556_c0_g1_i1.p1 TRINITY_DN79556_c0_g1~~TRINITY_DN79556_c0_g1_i1.p1  ORF type:complete len:778 (+),score=171.42 TRINITY_DN79556_c0_g1_i1:37-2370(+)